MSDSTSISTKIANNAIMLYGRQVVMLLVSLYTVRVVLSVLGAEDYGINNVVAGAVTMFSFLTSAMATGCQRFFSFAIGKNDTVLLTNTFRATLSIYLVLILILFVLGETVGLWFTNSKLVIPDNRMVAANWIYQFSLVGFCASIMSTPFMALIMAHEDMSVYAKYTLLDAAIKLIIVYLLYISPIDKLISYGFLGMCATFWIFWLYGRYCKKNYSESSLKLLWEGTIIKEIAGFNGWNLFGSFAWVVKNQGLSFLLNMFFGPLLNAAQGIAGQVRGAVNSFVSNFTTAVKPQIIKKYASGEYFSMLSLVYSSGKFAFWLMAVMTIPLCVNMEYVLHLWLTDVPKYSVEFTQLMLIEATFEAMSSPFACANQATGKIALYQFLIGLFGLLNLPFSLLAIKLGAMPEYVYYISIMCQLAIILIRMIFLNRVESHSLRRSLVLVLFPCLVLGACSFSLCYILHVAHSSFIHFCLEIFYEVVIIALFAFVLGLNKKEKSFVIQYLKTFFIKR